jgi:hypothetical protein
VYQNYEPQYDEVRRSYRGSGVAEALDRDAAVLLPKGNSCRQRA